MKHGGITMTEQQNELMIWLVWIHAAIIAIPVLIFTAKLEWEDLREKHFDVFRGKRLWPQHQPAH